MKTPATTFEIEVNGRRFSDATVRLEDQLEVNLVSLAGQDTAVLAVTAFIPGVAKGGRYVHSENVVLVPGDSVKITLNAAADAATSVGPPDPEIVGESTRDGELVCAFCGKNNLEVERFVAGPKVCICDECVVMCHDIMRDER
jgi:hypothetical protein